MRRELILTMIQYPLLSQNVGTDNTGGYIARAKLFFQYVTCQTMHFASLAVIVCLNDGCRSSYAN